MSPPAVILVETSPVETVLACAALALRPEVLVLHAEDLREASELLGGAHVTTKSRCSFERPQRIEVGQTRGHKRNLSVVERTNHFSAALSAIRVRTCYPGIWMAHCIDGLNCAVLRRKF